VRGVFAVERYIINMFDQSTFQVIDQTEKREICVCCNYDNWEDAEERAKKIASLLNITSGEISPNVVS
jgi:hypothetical protein